MEWNGSKQEKIFYATAEQMLVNILYWMGWNVLNREKVPIKSRAINVHESHLA